MSPNRQRMNSPRVDSKQTDPAGRARRIARTLRLVTNALALSLYLIFSATGSGAAAQGQRPSPRHGHALAYNPARGAVILFGGARGDQILSDTWELRQAEDGLKWKALRSAGPALRPGVAMAENPAGGMTLLVGTNALTGAFETWEFDGATKTWTRAAPGILNPPASPSYALALDERRGVVVLFCGSSAATGASADTWEWDAATKTWRGPFAGLPSPRTGHAMAFDSQSLGGGFGRTLLFGGEIDGTTVNVTWVWDGVAWQSVVFDFLGAPPPRSGHAMASLSGFAYFFGGHDGTKALGDTWTWFGANWLRLGPAAPPPARSRHAMATDRVRGTIVLFGGLDASGNDLGDTWELNVNTWTLVAP